MSRAVSTLLALAVLAVLLFAASAANNDQHSHGHVFRPLNAGSSGPQNTSTPWNASVSAMFPNGSFPSDADIQRYHIALWVSIGLVLAALSGIYSLAFMDFKKDTILYSTFNPSWDRGDKRH